MIDKKLTNEEKSYLYNVSIKQIERYKQEEEKNGLKINNLGVYIKRKRLFAILYTLTLVLYFIFGLIIGMI